VPSSQIRPRHTSRAPFSCAVALSPLARASSTSERASVQMFRSADALRSVPTASGASLNAARAGTLWYRWCKRACSASAAERLPSATCNAAAAFPRRRACNRAVCGIYIGNRRNAAFRLEKSVAKLRVNASCHQVETLGTSFNSWDYRGRAPRGRAANTPSLPHNLRTSRQHLDLTSAGSLVSTARASTRSAPRTVRRFTYAWARAARVRRRT